MKLHLDTTSPNVIQVTLEKDYGQIIEAKKEQAFGSQVLLPLIVETLETNHCSGEDLKAISVNPNAGSYTGTRVGVAVANALGYGLHVPVNNQAISKTIVEVLYETT